MLCAKHTMSTVVCHSLELKTVYFECESICGHAISSTKRLFGEFQTLSVIFYYHDPSKITIEEDQPSLMKLIR